MIQQVIGSKLTSIRGSSISEFIDYKSIEEEMQRRALALLCHLRRPDIHGILITEPIMHLQTHSTHGYQISMQSGDVQLSCSS